MSYSATTKPHVVLTPFPFQGHINPLFQLAKLLHLRGFHITFVHTESNHKRLIQSRGANALDGIQDFCFETIRDGHGNAHDVAQDIVSLCESISKHWFLPFSEILVKLNDSASKGLVPPFTGLISDSAMSFIIQAAEQFALPIVLSPPASACSFLSGLHFHTLFDKGLTPIKDESYLKSGYLDTKLDWIQGMKNIRLEDLPDHIRKPDPKNSVAEFFTDMTNDVYKASAIVFNTFDELEGDVLSALSSVFPSLYPIGPFPSFLNQSPHKNHLASLGSNLWKEETECLEWLESKEDKSVVYINFGSITVMSPEKLLEFAWGLANSKRPFLWIIRPDLVIGGSVILSSEFVNETSERGLITSWCPQEQVLNHPSIGVFLTHCGWNSTIESICAGVPMLCWPFLFDQPTNCRYICNEWEIGMKIDTNVKRESVEKLVNELMVGEKGQKMRQMVMELKKKAQEYTKPGGTADMNLDKMISEVFLKQK